MLLVTFIYLFSKFAAYCNNSHKKPAFTAAKSADEIFFKNIKNSSPPYLAAISVALICLLMPFAIPVSYTHLDVYKRQQLLSCQVRIHRL